MMTAAYQTCYTAPFGKVAAKPGILDMDRAFQLPSDFTLEQETLETPVVIKARITGPTNAPVVLALGGISANRHVCDYRGGHPQPGWWNMLAGENLPLDTLRYRILSFDFLSGEDSPETDPLKVSPADQARIAHAVCDYFEVSRLHAFVGASYGGMIGLHFARLFPERLERLVVACASHRPHPMGIAWRSIQRKIVRLGLDVDQAQRALSLARELGMTTYRTSREFGERFSSPIEVEEYLESRGRDFIGRMSPQRYLTLSQSIDMHRVDPGEIRTPVTLIGFRQDQLVPVEDIRQLSEELPTLFHFVEQDSVFGHDAFLKENAIMAQAIDRALAL